MRVLLINTNRMKPAVAPIGLDYLADALIAAGHEPRLLDLCFADDIRGDIERSLRAEQPQVVGVTLRNTDECYFGGGSFFVPEIKEIVDRIRNNTDAPIVMGGVGFSVAPEAVMDFCGVDLAVHGAGEQAFVELVEALEHGHDPADVPGVLYRGRQGVRRNPPRPGGDHTPRSRSFIDNPRYFREGGQAGIETKRGCGMACIYCAEVAAKGRHIHARPPRLVVDELRALLEQGIDHFHTCDCEFNIPGSHAKDVCRAIVEAGLGEKIRWYAYCSITPFDSEMAELFRRAGCAGVDFGADSGSDMMLRRLGRDFTSEDLVRTAGLCHDVGIPFMYDLLIGGPGETRETVRKTVELMRGIEADCVGVSMGVRIYEGTAMADFVRSQGDTASNPNLYGAKEDNPQFLRPVFYISPELGDGMVPYLHELVGGDTRFFLPTSDEANSNYNYNENTVLVDAIRDGARGAYWDILRRMQG